MEHAWIEESPKGCYRFLTDGILHPGYANRSLKFWTTYQGAKRAAERNGHIVIGRIGDKRRPQPSFSLRRYSLGVELTTIGSR